MHLASCHSRNIWQSLPASAAVLAPALNFRWASSAKGQAAKLMQNFATVLLTPALQICTDNQKQHPVMPAPNVHVCAHH